jgi:GDP-L-fucose synthase
MVIMVNIERDAKIFVAGHRGMVGSALVRRLAVGGYTQVLTRTRAELDLADQHAVHDYLTAEQPDYIFIAAAKVGGIQANNTYRADFLYQNLMIEANLIHGAHLAGVQRLMFLASSCIYPRDCPQPIKEEYLLSGPLEPTNEPYAIAKIAGIKLAENYNRQYGRQYVSVMPTNLYGPNDNYDLATSHVLPALLRKAHEARLRDDAEYVVWGSGTPRREFLYVDDLADAPDGTRLRRPAGQHRHRRRRNDPRIGRDRYGGGGLRGPHRLRFDTTRWHSAQTSGCKPDCGTRLARQDRTTSRYSRRLRERPFSRLGHPSGRPTLNSLRP